jgi:hypothetical protein
VLAVLPSHLPRERALEEPSAVIMKLQSDYMLQEWTRRLRHSAAQMQSVAMWHSKQACTPSPSVISRQAGPLLFLVPELTTRCQMPVYNRCNSATCRTHFIYTMSDAVQSDMPLSLDPALAPSLAPSLSVPNSSSSPTAQSPQTPTARSESHTGTTTAGASFSSPGTSTFVRVAAHLGCLAVHASARAAEEFWPPPDVSPPLSHSESSLHDSLSHALPSEQRMIDQERPLVSIVAQGGLLKYQQVRSCVFNSSCMKVHPLPCGTWWSHTVRALRAGPRDDGGRAASAALCH